MEFNIIIRETALCAIHTKYDIVAESESEAVKLAYAQHYSERNPTILECVYETECNGEPACIIEHKDGRRYVCDEPDKP